MNTDEARFALKTLDARLESVRRECVYALNDLQEEKTRFKDGKSSEEDVRYYEIKASLARNVLRELGYEVDYYFCGQAVIKAVEE